MPIGIQNIEQKCFICERECSNRRSLGNHLAKSHSGTNLKTYVLHFILNDIYPLCKCGCGKEVAWHKNHYHFNDYVNGHNKAGFAISSYKLTPSQRAKCTDAVRKTYQTNGSCIKQKISKSLKATLNTPEMHEKLSLARKEKWKNKSSKQKQSSSQKIAWSGIAGARRRKKVFTEEFSQKIGEANLRRKLSCTSILEQKFFAHIATIFPDAISSKWFNFEKKKWCADVWLPTQNAIIEFDGDFYHGLDRKDNFTKIQIHNMKNDEIKRQIILEKKMTMLRISESQSYMNVKSFDDLINISYCAIIDGIEMKTKLCNYDQKMI